jgi:predicted tellurium resistance membrane protein TerC
MSSKLPAHQQPKARSIGLICAMLMRIILLFCISWLMQLTKPIFRFDTLWLDGSVSGQSLIIFAGGLFLLYKSVTEIHHKVEKTEQQTAKAPEYSLFSVITQIVALDIVFSFDSVLTAVGLVSFTEFGYAGAMLIMIMAIIISIIIMLLFSEAVSKFINNHPAIQILGLSFLILIGVMLLVEAVHLSHISIFGTIVGEIPKGYIYFAIAFSLFVEFINMKMRKKSKEIKK